MINENDIIDFSFFLYENERNVFLDIMSKFINDKKEYLLDQMDNDINAYDRFYFDIIIEKYNFRLMENSNCIIPAVVLHFDDMLNSGKDQITYMKAWLFYKTYIQWMNDNLIYWYELVKEYEPLYIAKKLNII